ncbi:MAG: tRNA (guanosine(37)-N1)-methyltransferase TrmD [Candidatus Omnitrophica bacterium CG12_big_fil_rev_8_21_14_0_65_43_15]|uniref:tRNA (guanine-N(1)-)-methyltransferase n=1 Tax=Candidatus Taenaricola geysiri TaxID=1974752 RepID=A0A2J0LHU1_9BACT|nr:MAG: tRNA (guanosine(37)-N1)-methyltransferase TrmD [Candidatus Omnitrophica bacterium CG1_02_43_210]PIV11890.1 MAG: tRNA (guanosine(37)-N1)-methyltransferase TrmD [Candidatus Omnitrophica bacterium CG03_land_8_20_14_0_80_43_22]PIW66434.1 MAG: tRNA (guanosine(37)-N1)-methyltransferase TrmD [Candidatus Omnitrophica bacterium CG12_big_fil_rev_8_21_14_0_65_43_15]PIW80446.1 MAG: tRNA (guanosine(37)-N1)-methyltransferase TrmD [Candidatus Omnitrophica bacterium CG_4_8_14_3_um_filter_43_15]PIY84609
MKIDILTLFPGMFKGIFNESIIKRARAAKKLKINIHNLRDWSRDKHKKADDKPYGGGCGMVMSAQPVFEAVKDLRSQVKSQKSKVILLSPQGKKLDQKLAQKLSKNKHIILICGHYEGVDWRVRQVLINEEISIGDYILTGGEIPAMVLVDTVARLIPGVLGHKDSNKEESFSAGLLEYPQYTRPAVYKGFKVPQVLLSGNHNKIRQWRTKQAKKITLQKRPDLIQ